MEGLSRVCFALQCEHKLPQIAKQLVSKYCKIYNLTMTTGNVVRKVTAVIWLLLLFRTLSSGPQLPHFPKQVISSSLLGHCLWQSPFSTVLGQYVPLLWRATPLTAFLLAQQPVQFIVTRLPPSS